MAWYNRPIQPIDPVVVSQQPKPSVRYVRDNFAGTGQDSHTIAPAQDQAMWQSLVNVQPITKAVIERRWGYNQFAPLSVPFNRLYNFQSDSTGNRQIIAAGLPNIEAFNENGTIYNPSIFVPAAPNGIVRSITSRNYQYFCDGFNALNSTTHLTGDSLKWNGAASGGVTNIGIVNTDTTANTASGAGSSNTVGPTSPGTITQLNTSRGGGFGAGASWSNINGLIGTGNGVASVFVNGTVTFSNGLVANNFGFAITPTATIVGIQVSCSAAANPAFGAGSRTLVAYMTKNGTTTNSFSRSVSLTSTSLQSFTFGGPTDLWNWSFSPSDITNNTFGVYIDEEGASAGGNTVTVQNVKITIFLGNQAGGSTTSGAGIGLIGGVAGGNVNLTIGRIYYMVGNNSSTGHFSDLSAASQSTGVLTNDEVSLLLATYNDPQVDTKYLLATADGGDPSILYEVQPLVPGLTITSWAINGANSVTFTGAWTGTPYSVGQTFVVGGLVHGSYMNTQTMTTTASTSTTLTANFTHAADSSTEGGVAGNYSYAIPNSVGFVVDNCVEAPVAGSLGTSPSALTLNQVLAYTDQFGNTYGVALNSPPPAGSLLIKHQGRLWMAGVTGATHSVYFSKSTSELTLPNGFIAGKYEEAWPASNYFDVSDGAENVTGLLSDGQTLYIGTQAHIRRLLGNAPANFQLPQIIHPQVGLINQEVWQIVFMQGAPSGSIWMTPDFRVIQSDFNTYVDIGAPIQDVLNSLQPQAQTLAHAAFVASGEYNLYILSVPVNSTTFCDTHLVFDLKARQWFVWKPATGSLALLFNITANGSPQWLFIDGAGANIDQYNSVSPTDGGIAIPVTATTSWLHLSEPTRRKILNELTVYGNVNMLVTVNGANSAQDIAAPDGPGSIVFNRALRQSPFGNWNLYLTGEESHHRYYQITFASNNGQSPVLTSYVVSFDPLDDI